MAKYYNGINGPFSGKIGNVVGSTWRGIHYLRSLPLRSSKPDSENKKRAQNAFSFINAWLKPIHQLVMVGFANYNPHATGRNSAHAYTARHALISTEKGFEIDFKAFRFSYGKLHGAEESSVERAHNGDLIIRWSIDPGTDRDDLMMYLTYSPGSKEPIFAMTRFFRGQGEAAIALPDDLKNSHLQVQIAFMSVVSGEVSTSQYVDEVLAVPEADSKGEQEETPSKND